IVTATQAGIMPPPAPDPSCNDYLDSDRYFLTDEDAETLKEWVEADMPDGDPVETPDPPAPFTIAPFDVELHGMAAYTPSFEAGSNEYRCWAMDFGNEAPVYITGMEALVDRTPM